MFHCEVFSTICFQLQIIIGKFAVYFCPLDLQLIPLDLQLKPLNLQLRIGARIKGVLLIKEIQFQSCALLKLKLIDRYMTNIILN